MHMTGQRELKSACFFFVSEPSLLATLVMWALTWRAELRFWPWWSQRDLAIDLQTRISAHWAGYKRRFWRVLGEACLLNDFLLKLEIKSFALGANALLKCAANGSR